MMPHPMYCAYCGLLKNWPRDFPATHYAKCADCTAKATPQAGAAKGKP